MMHGAHITPELKEALLSSPMVIVYLWQANEGFSPEENLFNNNVVFEYGLRDAIGKPYVVLKEENDKLPFDLKAYLAIDLPQEANENPKLIMDKVGIIKEAINSSIRSEGRMYTYPASTIELNLSKGGTRKFTKATHDLQDLFDLSSIVDKETNFVFMHILKKMPFYQRRPFISDQNRVLENIIQNQKLTDISIIPTIPIIFESHINCAGRAYLPMIIGHKFNKNNSVLSIRSIYLDVTSATKFAEKQGCYVYKLYEAEKLDLASAVRRDLIDWAQNRAAYAAYEGYFFLYRRGFADKAKIFRTIVQIKWEDPEKRYIFIEYYIQGDREDSSIKSYAGGRVYMSTYTNLIHLLTLQEHEESVRLTTLVKMREKDEFMRGAMLTQSEGLTFFQPAFTPIILKKIAGYDIEKSLRGDIGFMSEDGTDYAYVKEQLALTEREIVNISSE